MINYTKAELNELLEQVKDTQNAFWEALQRLERAMGYELNGDVDYSEYNSTDEILFETTDE